jgi:hypothetical protein
MQRTSTIGRITRAAALTAALSWICILIFVQWILLMTPAALQLESVTDLPLVDLAHSVRVHVGKPLSPPKQ